MHARGERVGRGAIRAIVTAGALACLGCGTRVPSAAIGAPRDAGPPVDSGTVVYTDPPPPTGTRGTSGQTTNDQTTDGGRPATTDVCVIDGAYRVLAQLCDGVNVGGGAETWFFSDGGHTVTTRSGIPATVDCVHVDETHTQLTIHGAVGRVSPEATTVWTAFVDGPSCLVLASSRITCNGSQAAALVDFEGPL